jgi:glycosyltransferase involved in cell wall biosynthesis
VMNGELSLWYNAATVFSYPSVYEGFGLPVLEAQACGTPVLTSNTSSLPEAAGDGALMVDPYDVEELAAGLDRLLTDEPKEGRREITPLGPLVGRCLGHVGDQCQHVPGLLGALRTAVVP